MTVESPSEDIRLKARVQLLNRKIFDFVQSLQKQNIDERKESFEGIKAMDKQLDLYSETCMQVKDRQIKSEMMEAILECKAKIANIINIIRVSVEKGMEISNVAIAQLNDVAYKAIRKRGQQKKLDERAVKNEGLFKKLDQ